MAKLLLTCSAEIAHELTPKIEALGHEVITLPLLTIELIEFTPPTAPQNIAITSRYALPAIESYKGTPIYIVGEKTAELANKAGHIIAQTALTARELEPFLPKEITYFRGKVVSYELPATESIICYHAEPTDIPDTLPKHDATILLSARAAKLMPPTNTPIFCLSERIAGEVRHSDAIICPQPTEKSLLVTIKHWSDSRKIL